MIEFCSDPSSLSYGPTSYDDTSMPDTYDEVVFSWSGTDAEEPQWRRLQGADLAALQNILAEGGDRENGSSSLRWDMD